MALFDRFGKKKNTPVKSAPVISRSGRIGRVSVEDFAEKKDAKKDTRKVQRGSLPAEDGYAISDRTFMATTEKKTAVKSKKRRFFTVRSKEKNPFPVMTVLFCAICTILFMSMIVNLVEINEYTKDVAGLQKHVETLEKQREELTAELSQKDSIDAFNRYRTETGNNLGMVESDKMKPPVAITPDKDGQIEDYEVPESEEAMVTVVLNALAKNLADTWNKFIG